MGDAVIASSEHWCRECYSENVIPVWEDIEDFEEGKPPDWIGCLSCREMRPNPDHPSYHRTERDQEPEA